MSQADARQWRASTLAMRGFADTERAARLLAGLDLDDHAVDAIADTPDPDLALGSLARIAENDRSVLNAFSDEPVRTRLLSVLGASAALGDHLAQHPADWRVLAGDDMVRPTRLALQTALVDAAHGGPQQLQHAYRRHLLGLAARDLSGVVTLEDVAGELADLAEAALQGALAIATDGHPDEAQLCRLAVIGMGKCGGRELNYMSDVDVVFVAEPDNEEALRAATTLATELIRICSSTLWPVDAALRPEGKTGPLVRTLDSHLAYYRRWARTWEFQALLKARPVAGDVELGTAYAESVRPLVWSASERDGFVPDVQAMRRRVEESLPKAQAGRQLKLGPGGLRDVEFAVQLLQLVHGRLDESLRSPTTMVALQELAAGGYVGRDDAARLGAAYRFLRTTEHRLQLQRLRRTHTVPDDETTLRWLARSLGYRRDPINEFTADWTTHAREVRRLHEKLFYRPLLDAVARLPTDQARLSPQAARARLAALGFDDPDGALRHIEALTRGVSRRAAIQRTLLPVMLGWFADAADPDMGLLAFRKVSDALGVTPWYLRLLRDDVTVAERLARLLATSRYVSDLLGRAPEAVRLLASDHDLQPLAREHVDTALRQVVERNDEWEAAVASARGVRRHELLRIACADLVGNLDVRAVGQALSDVADATLAAALHVAERKVATELRSELPMRIAIIAMGRLGGREQGYGSDADVLFVHDPLPDVADDVAAAAAYAVAEELRRLLALPAPDPPLKVDADLRPEGKQGPLTRSLASYRRYYARWSATWEAQALLRARAFAGDQELGAAFEELVEPVRWPPNGIDDSAIKEVRRIKARVEAERLPRGADPMTHTKLGRGALADVEWAVQLLQLRHAGEVEALRTTSTLDALEAARAAGLVTDEDAQALRDAWNAATHIRNAIMLTRGRPGDTLPTDTRELAGVARAVGYPPGETGQFVEDYRRTLRRSRAAFERVFF